MASSLSLRKLAQQLQAVASRPAQAAALLGGLAQRHQLEPTYLQELEQAIALVSADEKRHVLAGALYRLLDMHRVWTGDGPAPTAKVSVFTACVPFTVSDLSLIKSAQTLSLLTGPIDHLFSLGPRDKHFPEHKNFILAVPLVGLRLEGRFALNIMLANSHRDTPADQVYSQMWAEFISQDHTPEQAVFGYMFSLAVPTPSEQVDISQPFDLPMTPWAEYALDVLMKHAQRLNAEHPELGMRLHALTTLSEAGKLATDLRLKSMFTRYRQQVGRQAFEVPADATRLAGISPELIEEANAERRERLAAQQPPDEELYATAVLGRVTVTVQGNGAEFLQANLFSRDGKIAFSAGLQIPLGTRSEDVLSWWHMLDHRQLAKVVMLPTEHVAEFNQVLLGKTRDVSGRWVERELLHWGSSALEYFRTAKWSMAFGAESLDVSTDEVRLPVTQAFERLPLLKAVNEHYTPAVGDAVKRLLATPGLSRELAWHLLTEQFEGLRSFQLLDPFNAFLPTGMWAALHHQQSHGVLFRVDGSVQDQMALTDVDKRFPLAFLQCPFPDIYLHFEKRMQFEGEDGKAAWLEGAFLSERVLTPDETARLGVKPGTRAVSLTVVLHDAEESLALHYPSISFAIEPDDSRDLVEMLQDAAFKASAEYDDERKTAFVQASRRAVLLPLLEICKVLVYINLPNARLTKDMQRTRLLQDIKNLTGRERQRAYDRLVAARDIVIVGPLPPLEHVDEPPSAGDHRNVKPHPRRGFFRNQPYGEGLQLRRARWIPPVMVNKHLLAEGQVAEAHTYRVK